jgi:hypothetical protein
MSEEQPQAQESTAPTPDWKEPDWFLQTLVELANAGDGKAEIGMTLLVGGFLVSGKVVGGASYFEGFAGEFASGFADQTLAGSVREFFSRYSEIYKAGAMTQDQTTTQKPLTYVHMKEARFFNTAGNPIPGNRGVWWRGRLSEVSGFMVGILERG